MLVCLFVAKKCRNGQTDRAPARAGLRKIRITKNVSKRSYFTIFQVVIKISTFVGILG